jgi:hypothetical protein
MMAVGLGLLSVPRCGYSGRGRAAGWGWGCGGFAVGGWMKNGGAGCRVIVGHCGEA